MVLATDYPFLNILWTMIIFFAWVIWIWMMIAILGDVFRRRDISGWGKAAWCVFLIVLPFVGALVYLIANHDGLAERSAKEVQGQQQQFDDHVRSVRGNGGPAADIERAKKLLDSGAISSDEYETLKRNALAPA